MPAFANGIQLIAPQAVAVVLEESVVGNQPAASLAVAIIGPADGGQPLTFKEVFNYAQAKAIFRSGVMVDLLKRVYGPSASAPGAYRVIACRVNSGVQSSYAIKDAGAAAVINLVSTDYGLHTNQIQVKIEAGTTSGYKASVKGFDGAATIVQDNIARSMLSVQYTGAGSAGTLTTSSTQLTTTITGASDAVTLDFASYPTIQNLADALVGTGKYAVTVLGDPKLAANTLDIVSAINIKSSAQTLAAHVQALVDWFNNAEPYVNATRATGNAIAAMASFAALTGGTNGAAVTSTDYQNALTALQAQDCNIVVVGTDDATIHAMVDAHCALMAQTGANKERIAIVGGATGESVSATLTRAKNLGSYRTALAYPGLSDVDDSGNAVTLSSIYTAAAIAGLLAGAAIGQPATRKPVRCVGPAVKLTPSEIDTLLAGGVMAIQAASAEGARVVQSILTYAQPATSAVNLMRKEISCRIAADVLIARVRQRLDENLIGQAGGPLLREQARSIAETVLKESQAAGLIVGDDKNPAYSDLGANIAGDTITVTFRASIATPGNYVILRASLSSYSG